MKLFRNSKIVLLAATLVFGMALAPYVQAGEMHHHSVDMSDCSISVHCLSCGNPLPSSVRIDHPLSPSLDKIAPLLIPEVIAPAVSHYHPPG